MTDLQTSLQQVLSHRSTAVIDGWYRAVQDSAVALRSPSQVRGYLVDIWEQATAFLLSEDGSPHDAQSLGASFVCLGIRPQAVGRISQVLLTSLLGNLPHAVEDAIRARLPALIAGLVTGIVEVGSESLLEQQEEIREAYARSLRQAEEQLRIRDAGIQSSINGIMMLDLEGRITYVNPACLEMWSYGRDQEMVGRHVSEFGQWEGDIERTLQILAEEGGWIGELVAVREDGSHFHVQASVSPIQHSAAQPTQLMVFFVDVTARKKSQAALRRRAKQAAFLNRIGEVIAGERTEQGVLDQAVRLAQDTFDFHQVAVLLFKPQEERLVVAAVASRPEGLPGAPCTISLYEGITGWVGRHKKTAVVNDVSVDSRYLSLVPNSVATGSELAVPICRDGELVAVLDVQSPVKDAFGHSERVVLETLADQIAVALENAQLYQALQAELDQRKRMERALRRSVQRLETVHEIDQAILGAKSSKEIAEAVVRHLHRLVPCQRASIDLIDWECGEVIVLAAIQTLGDGVAPAGARFPLTQEAWLSDLWEIGEPVEVRDARDLPKSSPLVRAVVGEGIRSFLTAPIGFRGELMGLLSLGSDRLDGFGPEHKPIVKELADTTAIAIQQARLFDSVRRQRERLSNTMTRLAEAEEQERRRVVRELHDQVGQNLTALDLNLSLVHSQLDRQDVQDLRARLEDSLALVEQTNKRIRQLMIDLRPPVLDDYGLLSTLHWYGDRFSARTGIDIVVAGREDVARRLSPHVENALFRIAQEALHNTMKHAKADEVTITLTEDDDVIRLTILDNGLGFEPEALERERSSWGLLTMSERAESVGARCLFDPAPGEGTRVVVEVPT